MTPPDHLTEDQREVWLEALPLVSERPGGWLQLLEVYAVERCRWLEAEAYLAEHGPTLVLRSDKGVVQSVLPAPELAIAERANKRMLEIAERLRLMPAAP